MNPSIIPQASQKKFTAAYVARLIGRTQTTLLRWERLGLFVPDRLANGYRVYSARDIELIQSIAAKRGKPGRPPRKREPAT